GRLTSPDYEGQIRLGVPCDVVYPHIPVILKEFSRDYPRVQVKFTASHTFALRSEFKQGLHDIVLTTEKKPNEGGQVLCTQRLVWTGAEEGQAWKKRPLPLGFAKNCAFRSGVTDTLDQAGIDWIDVVASDDALATEAMTAADLCVSAELESVRTLSREAIDHGGQLPELPKHSIILYGAEEHGNPIIQIMSEYLQRVYA
ncbi:MAG: LysR substrate-binding domain-containing protein, partial [Pseudomonadota bacterium]